jgi:hypothetical protein
MRIGTPGTVSRPTADWHRSHRPRTQRVTGAPFSRSPRGPRITCPAEHVNSRTGEDGRRRHEGRVPGIRRPPCGRRQADSSSAVPGSRTRETENELGRTGGRAVLENVPPTLRACLRAFSRGAPSESAPRRSAPQPPSRPSRRPEVAEVVRGRRTPLATAGRRAGAEARQAPNATAGRCLGEPGPGALQLNQVLRSPHGGARRR